MYLNLLQQSKDARSLIGFNYYSSDSEFYCGYVLDFNEDFVIIQHFSKYGISDGVLMHKLSDVRYFESETVYLDGMKELIKNNSEIMVQTYEYTSDGLPIENYTQLLEKFIGDKNHLIKIELLNENVYFGFIEWCEDESFAIMNIDSDGIIIGKAIFRMEDLRLYWIDDLECRRRKILYWSKYHYR